MDVKKLEKLAEIEGYKDYMDMLEEATMDSCVPAICTNEGCTCSYTLEPDATEGLCENCGTYTVCSCLVIAGLI